MTSILHDVGLTFTETMAGKVAPGAADCAAGLAAGAPFRFDAEIEVDDLADLIEVSSHTAELTGTVTSEALGGPYRIEAGVFNLFAVDPATGDRHMTYAFRFTARDGQGYYLHGFKVIKDHRGSDLVADMTHLFTTVHLGPDDQAPVWGRGILVFPLKDAPALVASMRITRTGNPLKQAAGLIAFTSFAYGTLRDVYLSGARLTYDTRYDNLVLAGRARDLGGAERPFFLVSGCHDVGFPWGDGEAFWDLLLVVGDGAGGWTRYAFADRVLTGLRLEIEDGVLRYSGPLHRLTEGYASSFSAMRSAALPGLEAGVGEVELRFSARGLDAVPLPFPRAGRWLSKLIGAIGDSLREVLPSAHTLGLTLKPYDLGGASGRLAWTPATGGTGLALDLVPERCHGEAERAGLRNLKAPPLLYGYRCAVRPDDASSWVQIHTGVLRNERTHYLADQLERVAGTVFSRIASAELRIAGGALEVNALDPEARRSGPERLMLPVGDPVLEVRGDHYPTAVFLRRIVEVDLPGGERCLALEEAMSLLRLEPEQSDQTATVAAFRDAVPEHALDRVLLETGFDAYLEHALALSGKAREDFAIAIKPNFMFSYSRADPTTFTSPALVKHLAARLRAHGFRNLAVVEAQNAYNSYFLGREVPRVARYLGYDEADGYRLVDLTAEATGQRDFPPPLGPHPISPTWAGADFRISFAKNKTHAYAYFTLTLKNVYGALPLQAKFKEYHCDRGIYATTLQYLAAYPVHFGLIDAGLSADGPFGVFADPRPNPTRTVIGGADLVAVDWVGASKMGIDPEVSPYLRLAVEQHGRPRIRLIGDDSVYRPWLNVPAALTLFTNRGLDADFHIGNLIYAGAAEMDQTEFAPRKLGWFTRLLRKLTVPIRRAFFIRTGENPTWYNRFFSWLFFKLGY
jgi:uncharacterized protein (DUF362 family)